MKAPSAARALGHLITNTLTVPHGISTSEAARRLTRPGRSLTDAVRRHVDHSMTCMTEERVEAPRATRGDLVSLLAEADAVGPGRHPRRGCPRTASMVRRVKPGDGVVIVGRPRPQ